MARRTSLRALSSAVLLALLLTAAHPLPAYADEGTPPPIPDGQAETAEPPIPESEDASPPPEEATPAPDATGVPDDPAGEAPAVSAMPTATETTLEAPADEQAAPPGETTIVSPPSGGDAGGVDPAPDAPADAATEAAALLDDVPDGTTIAIVDDQGEPVPLVSDEAAAMAASGDPVWCPASVKAPTPNANGCTDSYASLQALISWLDTHEETVDGVIWIEGGPDTSAGPDISLSGIGNFATMSNYRLTLRGGWDGASGSKVTDPAHPSEFDVRISITDWHADVTLSDIVVAGTAGGYGLTITQAADSPGSISLTRVHAHDNASTGARLDNHAGTSTGKVTVTASRFNNNGSNGLVVYSDGAITLADVTASGNTGSSYGAYLDNQDAPSAQPVTLIGLGTFNDNGVTGLIVYSKGRITAADLTASGNGAAWGSGVELRNNIGTAAAGSPGITLTGTNIFTANQSAGLSVHSYGPIALSNVNAHSNLGSAGLYAESNGPASAVTLSGTNAMKYNGADGLEIYASGKISLNNLTASGNAGFGARIDNTAAASGADVLLSGASAFHDNASNGLFVRSFGAITAANLAAHRNGGTTYGYGASLDNRGAPSARGITLTGTNIFQENWTGNVYVQSDGAITASNLTATGSRAGDGGSFANEFAATPQKITLSGVNTFSGNWMNGLEIASRGIISVSSLSSSENGRSGAGGHGAYLHNDALDAVSGITLTGASQFNDNLEYGLFVQSLGALAASSLTAGGNGTYGARFDNDGAASAQKVTLTGTNVFTRNYDTGLILDSNGAIAVANLTASGSTHGSGAALRNNLGDPASPQTITLSGTSTFANNYGYGLTLLSYGAVSTGSLLASGNGIASGSGNGVSIDNGSGTLPRPITLSGASSFLGNDEIGLSLRSLGAIKVSNLTASDNGLAGANLFNSLVGASGGVTLTGAAVFLDNAQDGLHVASHGAIAAANVTARGNGVTSGSGFGAMLLNDGAASPLPVSLTGKNTFTGNQSGGLFIESLGAISLSSLTASENVNGAGAEISNGIGAAAASSPGITLTGASTFLENYDDGLILTSYGALTASSLAASGNGHAGSGSGAILNNSGSIGLHAVKLTGANVFNDNQYAGLAVYSRGAVSLSSLTALNNVTGIGVDVENGPVGSSGGIMLSGVNRLEENGQTGLYILTRGPVTLNSLTASSNGLAGSGSGAIISNQNAATPQPVKLTGTNTFNDNDGQGLFVASRGAITANNLSASRNAGGEGASLDNNVDVDVPSAVTLTGTNLMNDNSMDGLYVVSYGAITINNLTANGNGTSTNGYGAYLVNTSGATPQAVKLTGTNTFNGNYDGGLGIAASGAIAVNNLSALDNAHADGVTLDNQAGSDGVTLTGTNTISDNFGHGLAIRSNGAVSATRLTADGNLMYGLYILGPADSITLTCGSFTGNGTRGIYAVTDGLLSLIGVISSGNAMANFLSYGELSVVRNCPL